MPRRRLARSAETGIAAETSWLPSLARLTVNRSGLGSRSLAAPANQSEFRNHSPTEHSQDEIPGEGSLSRGSQVSSAFLLLFCFVTSCYTVL